MSLLMARRTKRLWTIEEKRSICLPATAPGGSVAHVARRYALSANVSFQWLRDPRFMPDPDAAPVDGSLFLPVEIIAHPVQGDASASGNAPGPGDVTPVAHPPATGILG